MKKIIALLLTLSCAAQICAAQDKGLILLLGPAVNLYWGDTKKAFAYTDNHLSYQFNGQLGYVSTRGGTIRGNMLGIFASAGSLKPEMITEMGLAGAELAGIVDVQKRFNPFYTLEAGMVVARVLRLSGGIGRQYYMLDNGSREVIKFFTGTAGISIDLGAVNWVVDTHLMTGGGLNQNALRFSTGFLVKF
ncbi:MAG: hypothetical protein K2U26_14275 [Cyclobacteriaceae bacterium]|nr:hypothetical protein [Cyclobacteriaceae bacterium]